jgi:hypothetical protein
MPKRKSADANKPPMFVVTQNQSTDERRQKIFAALVKLQDLGTSVRISRVVVGGRFDISDREMREVEREGLDKTWPPLRSKSPFG